MLFETPRLVVRRASVGDADELLSIFGDPETVRHYGTGQPWSREGVEQFIASYPCGDQRLVSMPGLALLKPDLEAVGFGGVGYYLREGNSADLLFVFKQEYWGKGLATELAAAAVAEAMSQPQMQIIHATVRPANRASVRVLEKIGMRLQRYLPEADRLLYGLGQEDWQSAKQSWREPK